MPFSSTEFFDVFESYHRAVWPALFLLYASAAVAIIGAVRGGAGWTRGSLLSLAFLWAWMGIVYHWIFFTRINPAAFLFGALFVLQAFLLVLAAIRRGHWRLRFDGRLRSWVGGSLLVYALVLYPTLGYVLGHRFPRSPTFGLPCPTTILTLAILMLAWPRAPLTLHIIPWGWALIASLAPFQFGVWEDLGLSVAGILSIAVRLGSRHHGGEISDHGMRHPAANLSEGMPPRSGPRG